MTGYNIEIGILFITNTPYIIFKNICSVHFSSWVFSSIFTQWKVSLATLMSITLLFVSRYWQRFSNLGSAFLYFTSWRQYAIHITSIWFAFESFCCTHMFILAASLVLLLLPLQEDKWSVQWHIYPSTGMYWLVFKWMSLYGNFTCVLSLSHLVE